LKNSTSFLALFLFLGVLASSAHGQTYKDARGFYGQFAVPIGWNNMDGPSDVGAADGTMIGFSFTAGYRFNAWVGADVEVLWLGAGDVINNGAVAGDASVTSVGVATKFYPFVLTTRSVPSWIQPYVAFGVGTGIAEQSRRDTNVFGSSPSESVFLFRFGAGMEIMISKHWGTYMDLNYYASNSNSFAGFGMMRLGAMYHF